MKDEYDFSKGEKNPYADKIKTGYTVTVHYDFNQDDSVDVAKEPFDYTEWRRGLFEGMSLEDIADEASEYCKKNPR